MTHFLFATILSLVSLFLILLVLVQRGRGGGLTGALGGMGGQSAFGTKAGDAFTRITVITATVWILTAIVAVKWLGGGAGPLGDANAAVPPPGAGANAPGANDTLPSDLLPPTDETDAGGGEAPAGGDPPAPSAGGIGATPAESDPE